MKHYIQLATATAVSIAILSLTACNDSGTDRSANLTSSAPSSANLATQTGYFIDAEVKGLNYKTSSGKVGKTNNIGQFFYQSGDSVSFSVGNLVLGQAKPQSDGLITPKDLALKAAEGDKDKAAELEALMLRVLQSLDVDSNPSNGITISPRLTEKMEAIQELSMVDNTETSILNIDDNLRKALDTDDDGMIDVSATDAKNHAKESLSDWHKGIKPSSKNHGNNQSNGGGGNQSTDQLSDLTDEQKYSLAYMWNEERLAKDIYLALNAIYPMKQFENIAMKSEVKHIDAVEDLVEKYNINILNGIDYTVNYSEAELRALPAGTYNVASVQTLYNDLYAKGSQSKVDALQVGCMVEVTDVNDLDKFIDVAKSVNATDLISVYAQLRAGSYKHYWAFDKALKNEGVNNGCASVGAEYAKTIEEYPSSETSHDGRDDDRDHNGKGDDDRDHEGRDDDDRDHEGRDDDDRDHEGRDDDDRDHEDNDYDD